MAYKDFTLERLELEVGIENKRDVIFNQIQTVEPSGWLLQTLALSKTLPCGARIFNESRKNTLPVLYGCVTTGEDWLFMKLEQNTLKIDTKKYNLQELPVIIGIFQAIIDFYKNEK